MSDFPPPTEVDDSLDTTLLLSVRSLVPDVLDATEDSKHLAAGATVLGAELGGETLAVAKAPVDGPPGQSRAVDGSEESTDLRALAQVDHALTIRVTPILLGSAD